MADKFGSVYEDPTSTLEITHSQAQDSNGGKHL